MSGGSWDYVYHRIEEIASNLKAEKSPLRRALGNHMDLITKAMHDIEWVDSGDMGQGDDAKAIRAALGPSSTSLELAVLVADAKELATTLSQAIDAAERVGG